MEERLDIAAPGGIRLAAVLHLPSSDTDRGAVICHGMMSSKDSPKHTGIAEGLCARGLGVMRFDFSGRGESGGDLMEMTFTRQVTECRAVLEEMGRRGFSDLRLVGSSMGGAVAILTAANEAIHGLATMASVGRADLLPQRAVGEKGLAVWERKGFIRIQDQRVGYALVEDSRRVDVLQAAAKVRCPWLILHGEEDEVIPVTDAEALHRASGGRARLEIVPGADHRFSADAHRGYITRRIVEFLTA